MRSSALFSLMLVGVASVASAQPKHEETSGRVSYNKKPKAAKHDAARQQDDWIELASPTPAKHGTEFIVVGKDAGEFSQLRIDASTGKVIVLRVRVYFADGTQQTVSLDRRLDAARLKSTIIDLKEPKPIDRVVITTEDYTSGAYALYGSSGGGGVARR